MEPPPILKPPVSRRGWWIHLLLITAYILAIGLLGMERKPSHTPALLHTVHGLLYVCVMNLLLFGLVFGLAWLASRASRDDLRLRWHGVLMPVLLGIGYSVAIRVVAVLVMIAAAVVLVVSGIMTPAALQNYILANRPDVEALVDVSALRHDPVYFWLTVTFTSFVVAGLREELWRSAFLAGMQRLWPRQFGSTAGQVGAVCIAAVLFGGAHLAQGVLAAGMAGVLGIGLGLIMVGHRSIWPAVIAHGLFDATSFAMLPWVMGHVKN